MRTGDDVYYLSPAADFIFRYLFTISEILTSLVNSVIELYNDRSNEIISIDHNIYREVEKGRAFILDIKGKDEKARHFNVESQQFDDRSCDKRFLMYWSGTHSRQLKKSQSCKVAKKTISILLLWYDKLKNGEYLDIHRIESIKGNQRIFEDLEMYLFDLTKFKKGIDELETLLDVWLYFLANIHTYRVNEDLPEIFQRYPEVILACQTLRRISLNIPSRMEYDSWSKSLENEMDRLKAAEEKGETRGIAIGKEEGRHEGLIIGLLDLIHLKFGDIPPKFLPTIERMSQKQILDAQKGIFTAQSIDELLGYPDELRDISSTLQFASIESH
jgi:predicted transposase/invertase (TIGR01784 family)